MSTIRFSVVIPTCQREALLARCMESLRPGLQRLDPARYEVIVTDDSREATCEAMMRAQFPWARWVQGPSRGPAANRNSGVRHATGEWVCFIDDDCIADEDWLAVFDEAPKADSIGLLEGRTVVPVDHDNPFHHSVCNEAGGNYWSCNLAVDRELFLSLGGFDEDFLDPAGEDMEFAHRFHAHKHLSAFFPKAIVYHPVRAIGWRGVWKKLFMIRWLALYQFKIDEGFHLSDSTAVNLGRAFIRVMVGELRQTRQDLRDLRPSYWKDRTFWLILRWATLPVVLPYYLCWVVKFQAQLRASRKTVRV